MSREIEERKAKLKEAIEALRSKEEQVYILTAKRLEIDASLGAEVCTLVFASGTCTATGSPCLNTRSSCKCLGAFSPITTGGIRQKFLDAEERKKNIMQEFVSGEKTRAEVDKVVKGAKEAKEELEIAELLLMATEEALKKAQMEVVKMVGVVGKARQAIWEEIYKKLKSEIRDAIGDRVNQAIAAALRGGLSSSYQHALLDLCGAGGPMPSFPIPTVFEEMAKHLEQEYGIEDEETPLPDEAELRVG